MNAFLWRLLRTPVCHLEQYVQAWQQPRLDSGCWTLAMSLSQEGQARATPSLPLCPDLPSWGGQASVRHTVPLLTFRLAV